MLCFFFVNNFCYISGRCICIDNALIVEKPQNPNDYERFGKYFKIIVEDPDYIIEANKPNTAVILKEIVDNNERFKTILRLITSSDDSKYKNSIITFMKIDEKDWKRVIKNKKVLYKSE